MISSIITRRVVNPTVASFYFIKIPPRYEYHQYILVIIHAICKADSLLRVIHLLDIFLDLKSCRFCYRLPLSCKPARKQIVSPCRFPIRVNLKVVIHDRTDPEAQAVRREAQRLRRKADTVRSRDLSGSGIPLSLIPRATGLPGPLKS